VWKRLDGSTRPRLWSSQACSKWQPGSRCWALLQRAMTAKRARVRLVDSSEFSRGVLTLHHGSGCQASCQTPWWTTPDMAAPAELDRDASCGVAWGLVPAPLETFLPFLRLLHGRAVQTARPRRLSSRRLPLQGDHLSPCMRLSDFIHAAMNCPREKQATGRRTSHPRQATDVGARCPCPRVSLLAGGHM
jgi:hypothetical protein